MNEKDLARLHAADDRVHWDCAPILPWKQEIARVKELKPQLERASGHAFELEDNVQDASFFADLAAHTKARPGLGGQIVGTELAIRFSGFGRLVTIFSTESDESPLPQAASLVGILEAAGYLYVPCEVLEEEYSGNLADRFPQITTWWLRFFDYT
jgi:hypothetical protein